MLQGYALFRFGNGELLEKARSARALAGNRLVIIEERVLRQRKFSKRKTPVSFPTKALLEVILGPSDNYAPIDIGIGGVGRAVEAVVIP
jgi:hypothetical protein